MKSVVRTLAVALSSAFLFSSCNSTVQQTVAAGESTNELRILPRLANIPDGTSYVCGSLIIDPAGAAEKTADSVVFTKGSLSFKTKVKKGSTFRLTLAGKNASLSYNWVIDTTVTTDANMADSTLLLNLGSATPVTATATPVAAEALPVGKVTAESYVLKLKDAVLGKGQSIHYTLDGSIPTLTSLAYDPAMGIVVPHPAAADTLQPTVITVSTITDMGALSAWQGNVVYKVSFGGTAVPVVRDSTLKSLTATNGKLNIAFNKSILAYTDTVEYDAVAAFFSAEPTDPTAEVSGLTASIGALAAGSTQKNIIRVTNTKNGVASKLEYVVTIYKRPQVSVDSLLKTLSVAKGSLTPAFSPLIQTYVDEVAAGTTSETFVATAAAGATVTGTGVIPLTKDTTDVVLTVTNNGAKLDYKVKIVRKAATTVSQDSTLSKLSIAGATLSPAFDKSVLMYTTDSLDATTATVSVSATATAVGKASITYNGAVSNSITLAAGANPVVVKVKNGTASLTYTVTILRKVGTAVVKDASLKNLVPYTGKLTPAFSSTVYAYTDTVSNDATFESFTATPTDPALKELTPQFDVSALLGGETMDASITVTNGTTKQLYKITIVKAKGAVVIAHDTTLKSLTVTGGGAQFASPFDPTSEYTSYNVDVDSNATSVTIAAVANATGATVSGAGVIDLKSVASGTSKAVTIRVTNGSSSLDYIITIRKAAGPVDPTAAVKVTMLPNTDVIVESGKTYSVTSSACNSTLAINGSRDIDVLINGTTSVTGMDYKPTGWPGSPFTIKINAGTKISCY